MSGPLHWIGRHAAPPAPATTGQGASAGVKAGATAPTADADDGRTRGKAVQAARTLLDTLTGSSEGVSLVSVITEAILRNRGVDMGDDATVPDPAETTDTKAAAPTAGKDDDPAEAEAGSTGAVTGDQGQADDGTGGDDRERADAGGDDGGSGTEPRPDETMDGYDGDGDHEEDCDEDPSSEADGTDDGEDATDPETEERYTGQFGARVPEYQTYYPNLETFVEEIIAKVFLHHQSATKHFKWVKDWWNYPALVFPLDAMWRSYETARRAPGQMMVWYMQAYSLLNQIFNSDEGIVASLDVPPLTTARGESMPCERPPRGWRARIVNELAPERARRPRVRITTVHSKENER